MLRLITDFDGPIIDVSERYYNVYKFCWTRSDIQISQCNNWAKQNSGSWRRVPEKKLRFFLGLTGTSAILSCGGKLCIRHLLQI